MTTLFRHSRYPTSATLAVGLALWGCGGGDDKRADWTSPGTNPSPDAQSDAKRSSAFDFETGLLRHYSLVQNALARDELYEAQAALASLAAFAAYSEGDLKKHVEEAVWANDIETVRQRFASISEGLLEHELPEGYGVAHCPMAFAYKGARWIQPEGEITNPYLGASMLHCGAFEPRASRSLRGH